MHQLLKYSLLILPLHLNVIFAAFRPPRCITNLINAPKSSSIPPLIDTTEHNVPRPHEGVTNKKNRRRSQRGYHLPEDGEMAGPLPGETRPLIPIPEDRAVESRDTTNHEHGTFTHPVVYSIPPQTGGTWSRTRKSSRPMFLMPSASLRRLLDTVRPSTNQIRFYVLLLALYFITTIMILCGAGVGMYQAILWCFAALGPKAFVENWGHFLSSCLTVGLTLGMFGLVRSFASLSILLIDN